mmetsp:Transcript_34140/g.78828  ORF Transcript_34140/g.78828 Transcript_34140/m.78828 type:complete len:338 (+) Transcript_34140:814-1827(+)
MKAPYSAYSRVSSNMDLRTNKSLYNFFHDVVMYVDEWRNLINKFASLTVPQMQEFLIEVDHYNSKLNFWEQRNKDMGKKEKFEGMVKDKLKRNKIKLSIAQKYYDDASARCALFMKEVTERAWVDLLPVVVKVIEMDANYHGNMSEFSDILMNATIPCLKSLGLEGDDSRGGDFLTKYESRDDSENKCFPVKKDLGKKFSLDESTEAHVDDFLIPLAYQNPIVNKFTHSISSPVTDLLEEKGHGSVVTERDLYDEFLPPTALDNENVSERDDPDELDMCSLQSFTCNGSFENTTAMPLKVLKRRAEVDCLIRTSNCTTMRDDTTQQLSSKNPCSFID